MNRKQMNNYVRYYNLNLDYNIPNYNIEYQTNNLINNFFNKIKNFSENNMSFLFFYNDDIYSLITYKMLKTAQTLMSFSLYIYGNKKKTKKHLFNKEKFISKWKVNRLLRSNNTLVITPFNPIYKVMNYQLISNNFNFTDMEVYNPIERFTADELIKAIEFYEINYEDYNFANFGEFDLTEGFYNLEKIHCFYNQNVVFFKLYNEQEKNIQMLQQLQDKNILIFYYIDTDEQRELLNCEYKFYVYNAVNRPGEHNINNKTAMAFANTFNRIEFEGNWTIDEKKEMEEIYNGFYR